MIHTFGDSHADGHHSHWGYIRLPGINIKTHHLGGKLMYTFGKLKFNVLNIKNYGVCENDIVIFCFGEIDCRYHVHKHVNNEHSYIEIINDIVDNYFNAIKQNVEQYNNIKTCVYNVIPPTRGFAVDSDHPYPFLGSDEDRKMYYKYMNEKLKELCKVYNYYFFDIYDACCDHEGFLKTEYSDGNVHLRNTEHSSNIIKNLYI
jgi:hypothetical protein